MKNRILAYECAQQLTEEEIQNVVGGRAACATTRVGPTGSLAEGIRLDFNVDF